MAKNVPFVSNTDDDLHCVQAAYMIILKYFQPDTNMTWEQWSNVTGFEEGKGTWPVAALLWFIEQGFEVKHIEPFNFAAFAVTGEAYLQKRFSIEMAKWVIEHTNIPKEQKRSAQIMKYNICENRNPKLDDIKYYLDKGYLVRAQVNARKLNHKPGYFGHSVVVFAHDDKSFTLHDPGLPAMPNRQVEFGDFQAAWLDPDDQTAEMDVIKK